MQDSSIMQDLISSQDNPLKLTEYQPETSSSNSLADELPTPGTSKLRFVRNKGTNWYCGDCAAFVVPLWIRRGKYVYPACIECFYNDVRDNFDTAKEVERVAIPVETVVPETKDPDPGVSVT